MRINEYVVKNVKHLLFIGAILFIGWKYFYYQTANYFKSFHNSSAEILEVERKPGYGRFNGPTFIFTVHFTVDDTEHIISKIKVSKDAYNRYVEGDTVIVHYEKNNPYYVYLPDTSS